MAYAPTRQLVSGGSGLAGSRWGYLARRGFELRVASNLRSIESRQRVVSKVAADLPREVLNEVVDWELQRAIQYSSGGRTYSELRQYRPGLYSTQRPARKDDYIINVHTGAFRSGWRKRPVRRAGDTFVISLFNVGMKVAAWLLLGTRKMRERPLLKKVAEEARPLINKAMTRARMRLLRAGRKAGFGFMERFN